MELADFPRPEFDNGWGMHLAPGYELPYDPLTEPDQLYDYFLDLRLTFGIHHVKLLGDGSEQSVAACRIIVRAGIFPTVRIYGYKPHPYYTVDRALVALYVAVGVIYFEYGNEPNLALEWAGMPDDGVVIGHSFVVELCRQIVRNTDAIASVGGVALIPAMAPGTELDVSGEVVCYNTVVNWFKIAVLDDGRNAWEWFTAHCDALHIAVAVHNRIGNHLIHYPDGTIDLSYPDDPVNQRGEPMTVEYAEFHGITPALMEWTNNYRIERMNPGATLRDDSTCFRQYELVDDIFFEALGYSLPIFGTEAGVEPGDQWDGRYPPNSLATHAAVNMEIFRRFNPKHPQAHRLCLFTQDMWIWDQFGHMTFNASPWRRNTIHGDPNNNQDLPAVEALRQLAATENFVIDLSPEEEETEMPIKAEDYGIPVELQARLDEWIASGGLKNNFMRHAVALGDVNVDGEALKLIASGLASDAGQMVLSLQRYPFPPAS